jgi:AcrR family transcriptional regulator
MEKLKNMVAWTEEGYSLFAHEGLHGLQVERLSRIVHLNKSSFYHYFGDMEAYCGEIIKLHEKNIEAFLHDLSDVKQLDPDYLLLLMKHGRTVMFQMHLTREKNNTALYEASEAANKKLHVAIQMLWSEFLGVQDHPDLAMRYFTIVRDMFNTRITFENLNYSFLHQFATETKQVVTQLMHQNPAHPGRR